MNLTLLQHILTYLIITIILILCFKIVFNFNINSLILVSVIFSIIIFGLSIKQVFKISVENYENNITENTNNIDNNNTNNIDDINNDNITENTINLNNKLSTQPKTIITGEQSIKAKNDEMINHINTTYDISVTNTDQNIDQNTDQNKTNIISNISNQTTEITDVNINETNLRNDINNDKNYVQQSTEYEQSLNKEKNISYKSNDSIVTDENIYAFDDFGYLNANQFFIPTNYKTDQTDYGRNYIPPELWYKNNLRLNLPVCVPANNRCTIKDNLTSGYPLDTIEWHASRRIMNPDGINVKYVEEKLNTGH